MKMLSFSIYYTVTHQRTAYEWRVWLCVTTKKHRTNFLVVCTPLSFSQHLYLSLMTAISETTFRGPHRKSHLHHFILSSALLASNYPDANCSDRGQSKNDLACCFLSLLIDTYCTLMLYHCGYSSATLVFFSFTISKMEVVVVLLCF